jgi:hypothetical protein
MQFCSSHRPPRAGLDPIRTADAALAVVALAMHHPPRHEAIALLLDAEHRGLAVTIVTGTERPDDGIEVVECMSTLASEIERIGALVLATVRPHGGVTDGDGDRWCEMSELAAGVGIELLEWFVVGDRIECPRDLLGEPPRWRSP